MLTQEDVGRRVVGKFHECQGFLVKVSNRLVGDIRWDYGARWDNQQVGKDFEFIRKAEGT